MRIARFAPYVLLLAAFLTNDSIVTAQSDDAAVEKFERISKRYWKIVQRRPRRGTALDAWYQLYVDAGKVDQLLELVQSHCTENPESSTALILMGLVQERSGHDDKAIKAYSQAALLDAKDYYPQSLLASLYADQLDFKSAIAALTTALQLKPPRTDLLDMSRRLGQYQLRQGLTEQALKTLSGIAEEFPDDNQVLRELAELLALENQFDGAIERWTQVAENSGKDHYQKLKARIEIAQLHMRAGRRRTAIDEFTDILIDVKPDSWAANDVRQRIEDIYLKSNDLKELIAYCERRLDASPDDIATMLMLARTQVRAGDRTAGLATYRSATELAPKRKNVREAFVAELVHGGDFASALQQCRLLTAQHPNDMELLLLYGNTYLQSAAGNRITPEKRRSAEQQAITIWARIADLREDDASLPIQVAEVCRRAAGLEKRESLFGHHETSVRSDSALTVAAEKYYREAIRRKPTEPQYYEYLGEFLQTIGRHDEAVAVWRHIVASPNDTAAGWHRLAEIYSQFHYPTKAIAAGKRSLDLSPDEFAYHDFQLSLMLEAEDFDTAFQHADHLQRVAENKAQDEKALRRRVEVFARSELIYDEIDRLQQLDQDGSATARDHWLLALLYDNRWRMSLAAVQYEAAVEKRPDDMRLLRGYAKLLERLGRAQEAVDLYRKLAAMNHGNRAESFERIVDLELKLGHKQQARAAVDELAAMSPGSLESYTLRASVAFRMGEIEYGLETLRRAIRLAPREILIRDELAKALAEAQQYDESLEQFWHCFELSEKLSSKLSYVSVMTEVAVAARKHGELVDKLKRFKDSGEDLKSYSLCLAESLRVAKKLTDAAATVQELLASRPDDLDVLQYMVNLESSRKRWDAASIYQRQIVSLRGGRNGLRELAQLLVQKGDQAGASELWKRLMVEVEDDTPVVTAIDKQMRLGNFEPAKKLIDWGLEIAPQNYRLLYRAGFVSLVLEDYKRAEACFADCRTVIGETQTTAGKPKRRRGRRRQSGALQNPLAYASQGKLLPAFRTLNSAHTIFTGLQAATGLSKSPPGGSSSQKRTYQRKLATAVKLPTNAVNAQFSALCASYVMSHKTGSPFAWYTQQHEKAKRDVNRLKDLVMLVTVGGLFHQTQVVDEFRALAPDDPLPHLAKFYIWAGRSREFSTLTADVKRDFVQNLTKSFTWLAEHRPDYRDDVLPAYINQAIWLGDSSLASRLTAGELETARQLSDLGSLPTLVFQIDDPGLHRQFLLTLGRVADSTETNARIQLAGILRVILSTPVNKSAFDDRTIDALVYTFDRYLRLTPETSPTIQVATRTITVRTSSGNVTRTVTQPLAQQLAARQQAIVRVQMMAQQQAIQSQAQLIQALDLRIKALQQQNISSSAIQTLQAQKMQLLAAMRSATKNRPAIPVFPPPGPYLPVDVYALLQQMATRLKMLGRTDALVNQLSTTSKQVSGYVANTYLMAQVATLWWADQRTESVRLLKDHCQTQANDQPGRLMLAQAQAHVGDLPAALATLNLVKTTVPKAVQTSSKILQYDINDVIAQEVTPVRQAIWQLLRSGTDQDLLNAVMTELESPTEPQLNELYRLQTSVLQTASKTSSFPLGYAIQHSAPARDKSQTTKNKMIPCTRILNAASVNSKSNQTPDMQQLNQRASAVLDRYPSSSPLAALVTLVRFSQQDYAGAMEAAAGFEKSMPAKTGSAEGMLVVNALLKAEETRKIGIRLAGKAPLLALPGIPIEESLSNWTTSLVEAGHRSEAQRVIQQVFAQTHAQHKTTADRIYATADLLPAIHPALLSFAIGELSRKDNRSRLRLGKPYRLSEPVHEAVTRAMKLNSQQENQQLLEILVQLLFPYGSAGDAVLLPWRGNSGNLGQTVLAVAVSTGSIGKLRATWSQHVLAKAPQNGRFLHAIRVEAAIADDDLPAAESLLDAAPAILQAASEGLPVWSDTALKLADTERIIAKWVIQQERESSITLASGSTVKDIDNLPDGRVKIESINVASNSAVNDSILKMLALAPHLKQLNLSGTAVTDKGMTTIGRRTTLTSIDISRTKVSDAGLYELAKRLKNLKLIDVTATAITEAGIKRFKSRLPNALINNQTIPGGDGQ